MTRIERVVVHTVAIPLVRPFVTAVRTARELDTVLVELVDSDGRSGWGEAPASWRVTGESRQGIAAAVKGPIAAAVMGSRVEDLSASAAAVVGSVVRNPAARSAVDCALHDLAAQAVGLQLADVLRRTVASGRGLPPTETTAPMDVVTDMTVSASDDHDELVADAVAQVAAGFTTLKVKVGFSGGGARDREGVRRVREAVGPGIRLRVDANQAWSAGDAIAVIRGWEDDGIDLEFVEQPVAARRLDQLADVARAVSTTVMADESVWDAADLRELVLRESAPAVNVKLAKSGGLTEALAMIELAARSGIDVIVGCMMESSVGIGSAAALASALLDEPAGESRDRSVSPRAHDLDAGFWLASAAVGGGPVAVGERIRQSPGAGLGITGLTTSTADRAAGVPA
ncbi:dipeptide epimerase [Herbiconiux flava]|uniref:Dipeptide epimerase n=1 Tax=Herbiconiux flava TaxID=881268 RepID=A0A852SBZ6_9MICO|nr:dipeptide epimerase [Herbiconiux flava]NYD69932.1 L-alanine-DL-glutamate epimerase-like enolase superfamily enzyme [Herbiconiux flava]GLK16682.1 dipeptide epimerase [Herbiconiux flava]